MPGYEDLTPDQIIYMFNLVSILILVYCATILIRSIITWKISNNIKHLELMIEKKYDEGISKPTFFQALRQWWDERKQKKDLEESSKPIEMLKG